MLLANNRKGSMLTNAVGFFLAYLLKIPFTNHFVPVELYLNGDYWGSYNLTEKRGIYNNSIRVRDESISVLLEIDDYFDETFRFRAKTYNLPVNVRFPDFINDSIDFSLDDVKDDLQWSLS